MNRVELFNLAISACGSEALITQVNENTREAHLCRLWFDIVRRHVLSTAPWPSAMRYHRLTLNAERVDELWTEGDPSPGYQYRYTLPTDFIQPYHLFSFMPFIYRGNFIHTNDSSPLLWYITDLPQPVDWDQGLEQAVMHYLAARIARPLTGSAETVKENFEIALHHIETAQANAAEMLPQSPTETLPDWITARGYGTTASTRYFYNFQHLNPVTA